MNKKFYVTYIWTANHCGWCCSNTSMFLLQISLCRRTKSKQAELGKKKWEHGHFVTLKNCCYSVTKSCPTLCDSMDYNVPGFPVLHYLLKFAQIHVHWVGEAIQLSHPLLPSSPFAFNLPSIRVFSNELALHIKWQNYWSFSFNISPSNEYSGLIFF